MNKTTIAKYQNVEYLSQPAVDSAYNTYSCYTNGKLNETLDFRFATPDDHVNIDATADQLSCIKNIYLNSMNMANTTIASDKSLKDTVLHINMNHYDFNPDRLKLAVKNLEYLSDLKDFLPKLATADKQQIFRAVSFENMSFALASDIKKECEKNNIKSYGMITDETGRKGYMIAVGAKNQVQFATIKPSKVNVSTKGLKNTQIKTTDDKQQI